MFWAGDGNYQWTMIGYVDCLWRSFRSPGLQQNLCLVVVRSRRPIVAYSLEQRLDDVCSDGGDGRARRAVQKSETDMDMGWVHPWVGLGFGLGPKFLCLNGLGWVGFSFSNLLIFSVLHLSNCVNQSLWSILTEYSTEWILPLIRRCVLLISMFLV